MFRKNIARSCQSQCRSAKNTECFEKCFQKYLRTIQTVNETIKEESYSRNSLLAYKGYPEPQIEMLHHYNPDVFPIWETYAFARKWDSSV